MKPTSSGLRHGTHQLGRPCVSETLPETLPEAPQDSKSMSRLREYAWVVVTCMGAGN